MPFVLRKLDRKAAFYGIPTIPDGDVQADALSDLRTKENALSVWLIDDDRVNLNRILAALAATRDALVKLDYALISQHDLGSLRIEIVSNKGVSCDAEANARWHRDVRGLSGRKLVEFAATVRANAELVRVQKGDVGAHIANSINNGFIDRVRLKPDLRMALSNGNRTPKVAP